MKITKITLAVLVSFLVNAVSFAGELTVTGSAKATYAIRGSDSTTAKSDGGKGIGIANEFTLGASGETDNGISWKYAQDIDGATVQDDASLTLTFPTYGTVGIFVSEGGISSKYAWSPAAYATGSDYGYTTNNGSSVVHDKGLATAAFTYGDDIGGFNNFQYHTPAGILPFGLSAKIAYAPNTEGGYNSADAAGTAPNPEDGTSAIQYQINAAPIDGLSVSASYFEKQNVSTLWKYGYEAGGASAKYAVGPVTLGYGKFYVQPAILKATQSILTQDYENTSYGIGFNVNESFAISYTNEKSEANKKTVTAATRADAKTVVETTIEAIQAAYTMGGMTISLASKDISDMDYTAGLNAKETVLAVSMAF